MKKLKEGFTLVELVVVIAIIGVLAAIIVPSIMGFVHEARVKADITSAKRLYETINVLITRDEVAYNSMHAESVKLNSKHRNTTTYDTLSVNTESGTERYKLVVVARIAGSKKVANDTVGNKVIEGNREVVDFAEALTAELKNRVVSGDPDVLIPMKAGTIAGKKVNSWAIVLRYDENNRESDEVEIWAFDRNNTEAGEKQACWRPLFRVYPGTCAEYLNES